MCGIAGVLSTSPGDFRRPVEAMLTSMAHRGPDDDGVVVLEPPVTSGAVVLGSRRLAILDRSRAAHQPMQDAQTGHWIAYNGEVYNFRQLREGFRDATWSSTGDTEVLLRAYGRDGASTLSQWRGMFAVAIWDAQAQRLLLARDRFGIKPLYYWQGAGLVVFASEVRALLASGLVPRRLSHEGVATFLSFGAVQDPVTIVDGVRALLPGHRAVVEAGRLASEPFWQVPAPAAGLTDHSEHSLVDELCERLEESVALHLVSDVPLGVFLSGGIDSSLIAALAQRRSSRAISTWAVAFQAPGLNEGPQAAAVAKAIGSHHHEIPIDPARLIQHLPEALRAMDQPTIDGLNTYVVSRAVREAGSTVALSGLGGDELFGGYQTFGRSVLCQRLPAWLRHSAVPWLALADRRIDRRDRWPWILGWDRALGHPLFGLRCVFGPRAVRQLLGGGDSTIDSAWGAFAPVCRHVVDEATGHDPVTEVSVLELRFYMANMLLRDTDAMSMAHSLEVRVPFLDHLFVEWALRVPGTAKLGSSPKPLLAAALRRLVPSAPVPGEKRGFVVPLADWIAHDVALRQDVDGCLRDSLSLRQAGVAPDPAQQIWHQFLRGRRGWAQPWALFVLSQWARRWLP